MSRKLTISFFLIREHLATHYEATGELLVDLGSDQTSLHNPYNGGYYPVQVKYIRGTIVTGFNLYTNIFCEIIQYVLYRVLVLL